MKKILAVVIAATMVFTLAACGQKQEATVSAEQAPAVEAQEATEAPAKETPEVAPTENSTDDAKVVGIAIYSMAADSCVECVNSITAAAEAKGWTINLQDANGDPSTQADQMNTLINAGVDVIMLNPTDVASLKPSLEAAKAAGIPVIAFGMQMNDDCMKLVDSFVGLDDYLNAYVIANYVKENYNGQGAKMAIIEGQAGTDPTFKTSSAVKDAIAGTDIEIIGEFEGKFDAAEAMAITENLLVSNPDVKIIMCQDHVMAGGAVSAIEDAGKTGEVVVVAVCGMPSYLDYIRDGSIEMVGLVMWSPIGGFTVDIADKIFKGEKVGAVYFQAPATITKANVDNVTDDMFGFEEQ